MEVVKQLGHEVLHRYVDGGLGQWQKTESRRQKAEGRRLEISHSDQGCQLSYANYVAKLQAEDIRISWSR